MTTINFNYQGTRCTPPVQVCSACRRSPPTGVISYGGRTHEPHCEACCMDWEAMMEYAASVAMTPTLLGFRTWQAQRARRA